MTLTPEQRSELTGKWLRGHKPNREEALELIEQFRTREVKGRRVFAPVIDDIIQGLDSKITNFRYCLKEKGYLNESWQQPVEDESDVRRLARVYGCEQLAKEYGIPFPSPTVPDEAELKATVLQRAQDCSFIVDFLFNPYNGVGIKFLELLEIYSKGKFKPVMGMLEYRFERVT